MKDRIIDAVTERTGIDRAKAEEVVDTVLGYLKENPGELKDLMGAEAGSGAIREKVAPVAEKGKEALGEARERVGPVAEKGKEALGEAREKIAPVAAAAGERLGEVGEKVTGRLRGLFKKDDHDEENDDEKGEGASEPEPTTASTTER